MEIAIPRHPDIKNKLMRMKLIVVVLFAAVSTLSAQTEKPVDSKVTGITVFLSRAQVNREVKTRVEAGKTNIVVTGLTSDLDPQSIQVTGKGGVIILGTTHRQNYLTELNTPRSLRILKDSADYYQKQIAFEQNQKEILNKEEGMLMSNQRIGGTNQNLTVAELKAMADFYRTRLTDIGTARAKEDEKIKMLSQKLARLQKQINTQNELYARNTSEIVINVSAEAAGAVELQLNYVVANAGWYPVYDLRTINTKSPVSLAYKANVFQMTGEDWKGVHLKLSTANPNLGGQKPELSAWYLDFYAPVAYSYNQTRARGVASAPAMEMKKADTEEADKSMAEIVTTADFVNTIQTTLNTEFDIAVPYNVPSANQPTLVDIRNYEMKATYQYSVAPKLDMDAFLIAKATGWEEFSLLPGEANIFFEGTFVGKTFIDPNSIKDTLSVSMGRDKRIVVKREKVKDFTSRKAIGSNVREQSAYEISVRNTKTDAITIVVEDQVPISQNNQIEVTMIDAGNSAYNKDTGKLTWRWTIQPNEIKKATFKFEVKYPKDKTVTGL